MSNLKDWIERETVERFTPYYPPIPLDQYEAFHLDWRWFLPYRWTGDLTAPGLVFDDGRDVLPYFQGPVGRGTPYTDVLRQDMVAARIVDLKTYGFRNVLHRASAGWVRLLEKRTADALGRTDLDRFLDSTLAPMLSGIAAVVGFVPVLGQGLAALLVSASALATGRRIDAALLDAVVNLVPGGAAAKAAIAPAVVFGQSILEGKDVDESAIAAAREVARQVGGDGAALAFDVVLALARGQDLQDVGFALLNRWLPGNDLISRTARFTLRLVQAAERGESVERILLKEASVQLAALPVVERAQAEVDRGVQALLAEPRRYLGSAEAFAASLRMPIESARAAFMSVEDTGDGGLRENRAFRMVLIDPRTPIQGESAMVARAARWVERKRALRELTFVEARPATYSKYLAAKAPAPLFDPRGRTLAVYAGPDLAPSQVTEDGKEDTDRAEFDALARAIERSSERAVLPSGVEYTSLEQLGIAVMSAGRQGRIG